MYHTMNMPTFRERIESLKQTKLEHTRKKLALRGSIDIDDHGYVPWEGKNSFTPQSNHPSGGCYGAKCIGENFRAWLGVHPVYINPMSSLAGAWVGTVPGVGGWKPEERPTHLYPLHKKYHIVFHGIGSMNHLCPDMTIGLKLGWKGLLEKIRQYRTFNQPVDTSFYDGEESLVLGVMEWMKKHVDSAREMANLPYNKAMQQNLLSIADMNERLLSNPPQTLREACQFLAWFQSIDRMWAFGGALGQLDELLRPFYEADCAANSNDDEAVIWHIASLFFNDTHYSQVGGPAPDGHDVTSTLSFLILEASHLLKIPSNLAVRVHDKLDSGLMKKALQNLFEDGTGPAFSCSKGLDEGFARNGFPLGLARMRTKVGCNWTALPGIEYCLQDVTRLCLITPLLLAFDDMMANDKQEKNIDVLWNGFCHHLSVAVALIKEGQDWHMEHQAQNTPEIVLNLFCHGPIERGLDVSAGGVDIYNLTCDGIGLALVADSFAAMEQRIENEQKITWKRLKECLDTNYQDAEYERLMLRNIPRFGTGNSRADWWAKRVSETFTRLVKESPTPCGRYNVIPGLFFYFEVVRLGKDIGATPNGRRAGEHISHSANPDPGFAHRFSSALTAKATAVAQVQPGWGNSAPLQIDIDPGIVQDAQGILAIEAVIKTHNTQGGTLININVVSKEQILAAHADPSKFPDLVVRVTGYSAYFWALSQEYRQQIVDRFLSIDL